MSVGSTLMIIGNGFDLQCGLKSSYADFFEWLRQDDARANDNLWAVHFLSSPPKGSGWIDVEGSLQKLLEAPRHLSLSPMGFWQRDALDYCRDRAWRSLTTIKNSETIYIIQRIASGMSKVFNPYWFLDELIAFERQFSEYTKAEVSSNEGYFSNAAKLMDMMVDDEDISIINFNCTNPFSFDPPNKLSAMIKSVTNVHGTCEEDNIIFGVDATEKKLAPDAHIFTKMHRKMLQHSSDSALPKDVDKIKFYGHSLGKADYSYFQSIFDHYNLYGGDFAYDSPKVMLQFYFTVYDERKRAEIMRDATDGVYKLITAYGDTLDNKDKGKNLLHKLLLEGRVKIKILPDINSCNAVTL
ncbi:MAG: bacteriophage abortive infection AbiH family protein [Defluviitaleaceae bacterium]|nr:bacteriophage abortive infection AbiH family protein [Defluviitaleaceae bacterium]